MDKIIIALVMAGLNTGGQFLFKASAKNLPVFNEVGFVSFISLLLKQPYFYFAIFLYMVGTFFWVAVLTKYNLSSVYSLLAISYLAVPWLAIIFWREPLTFSVTLGSSLVVIGIVVLSFGN